MTLLKKIASVFRADPCPAPGSAPGRNDPCWCGSGQKYKRCHLDADRRRAQSLQQTRCGST